MALTGAMSIVVFAVVAVGISGCGSNKPIIPDESPYFVVDTISEPAPDKEPIITEGKVVETAPARSHAQTKGTIKDYSLKGCGFLIEIDLMGRKTLLQPEVLDTKFMKDGIPVTFSYTKSRRPVTCEGAIPIILDSIE